MGLFGGFKSKKEEKEIHLAHQTKTGRELFEDGKRAYKEGAHDRAENLLLDACETCADAVVYLGNLYCNEFNDNDAVEAFELYEKYENKVVRDKSYAILLRKLANCYYTGQGTEKNRLVAVKKMKEYRLYEENLDEIKYNHFLADCYIDLWNDIVKIKKVKDSDINEFCDMREEFEEKMGDALKMIDDKKYNKSYKTDYKWIMTDTLRKGFNYLETAAKKGDMKAAYSCARLIALPGFSTEYTEPIYKYLRMANDAGYHPAAADMFWRYINHFYQNVRPDVSEIKDTVERLKKGADAGNGSCQFALALCYVPDFVKFYGEQYQIGNVSSPLQPDPEKFIQLLEQAYMGDCREAAVYWAEYLAFGEIWLENNSRGHFCLLYKNEQTEHNPELAYKIIEDASEYLEEKKKDYVHDMQSYRTDVFLTKAKCCAKIYNMELCNQNVLFLFGTESKPMCMEAKFDRQHFLHLTGVRKNRDITAQQFYERALNGRLGEKMFSIPGDGTVELKLSVLAGLCRIHKNARMIGDYNNSKSLLVTEKLVGGTNACLGFVREDAYYIPNTALKEDIRDITYTPWQRIIATFRKPKKATQYTELCYLAKGVELAHLIIPEEYQSRVCLDTLEE